MVQVTFGNQPVTLVGKELSVGDQAPDFKVLDNARSEKTLADFKGQKLLLSVVPSLDTGVCDAQTRRFNEAASELGEGYKVLTISMDLPFAQKRWCGNAGVENVETLSDHYAASFGEAYGVLMQEHRLLARSIFVVNEAGEVTYVEYVSEGTNHPDYEKALAALKAL